MNVQLVLTTAQNAHIIKNLYPLYLHELSAFTLQLPNMDGLFDQEGIISYENNSLLENVWWEKLGTLFPFLITVDHRPAGFLLISSQPYVPASIDYVVTELFLLHPYRGQTVGEQAIQQATKRLRGQWELMVLGENQRALRFWHKATSHYPDFEQKESELEDFGKVYYLRFRA